jgi:hypothetical protein
MKLALLLVLLSVPQVVQATNIPIGVTASNYAILYEGTAGNNLVIGGNVALNGNVSLSGNVVINGNIGVGGTGVVQYSGPGTINGVINFAAANTGEFHNNNGSNTGPAATNYSVGSVTTALNTVNALSTSLAGLGNVIAINGTQSINASAGQLDTVNGVQMRVFNVSSYTAASTDVLTIVGDGTATPVVFNMAMNTDVNLSGRVNFSGTGLSSPDQLLFNFTSSGKNITLNNNGVGAFKGIILAPNDAISVVQADLIGRVFGGGASDVQIFNSDTITNPSPVPEPSSIVFFATSLAFAGILLRRKLTR